MADSGISLQDIPVLVVRCIVAIYYTVYMCVLQVYNVLFPPVGKSLKEKHVLITGAGGALGRELAFCFAREGCQVTCVDLNLPQCEETVNLISKVSDYSKEHTRCYQLDVSDRASVAAFAKKLESEIAPVDILVNNAGIVQAGGLLQVTDDQIIKIIDVNLMAHFWTIRAFLPTMLSRNSGHIVGISSAAALAVASNIAPYTASKAGVSALMGCVREEVRMMKAKVNTTTVQPFFISPPDNKKKHWEVKSVLPDITASSVASSTVEAVKCDTVTLTIPTYIYFLMYILRLIPAAASDLWRDAFKANIDSLSSASTTKKGD